MNAENERRAANRKSLREFTAGYNHEQWRFEAAKAALQGFLSRGSPLSITSQQAENAAQLAVIYADALLLELDRKEAA